MELLDETKESLKAIWDSEATRQDAKIVVMKAIGESSDVTVRVAIDILDEMDRMLIEEKEEDKPQINKAL